MRLIWTDPAVADLEAVRAFIAQDSASNARRFLDRLFEAVERLESFPKLGRQVPEARDDQPEVREILFQSYRVIYKPAENRILLLAVLHGSRDLGALPNKPWRSKEV